MGAIGIAIDGRWLSACQQRKGRELAVHLDRGASAAPLPSAEEVSLFASVLERHGFMGRRAAIAAPVGLTQGSVLDLPPAGSGAPVAAIAAAEMARLHKLAPGSFEVGLLAVAAPPRGASPTSAISLAHDRAEALLSAFDEANLDVAAIEPASIALVRAARLDRVAGAGCVIELGWRALRVVVSIPPQPGKPATPAYERTVEAGGLFGVHEAMCRQLELDEDVADFAIADLGLRERFGDERDGWALRGEVRELFAAWLQRIGGDALAAIDYAQQRFGIEVDRVSVCGCGTAVPGALEALGALIELQVEALPAWGGLAWSSGPARGVAMEGW